MSKSDNKSSGLATAALVLGIIAIVGAWIPFLNIVSIILAVLAFILGIIPLFQKRSVGKAVAGVVLAVASIIIAVAMLNAASEAIDDALSPTETSPSTQSSESEETTEKAAFDGQAAYDKISNGLTKQEVRDIAGIDPDTCTETEIAGVGKMETCSYGNALKDKVVLSITFTDGTVTNKLKMGTNE